MRRMTTSIRNQLHCRWMLASAALLGWGVTSSGQAQTPQRPPTNSMSLLGPHYVPFPYPTRNQSTPSGNTWNNSGTGYQPLPVPPANLVVPGDTAMIGGPTAPVPNPIPTPIPRPPIQPPPSTANVGTATSLPVPPVRTGPALYQMEVQQIKSTMTLDPTRSVARVGANLPVQGANCGCAAPANQVPALPPSGSYLPPPTIAAPVAGAVPATAPRQGPQPLIRLRPIPAGTYVGQGVIGQPTAYVNGQPLRNMLRWIFP